MSKDNKHFVKQFFIFGTIGGVGLFVNLAIYNVLIFTVLSGREMVANVVAVCLTILFNWFGNRLFTFKDTGKNKTVEAVQFFISSGIALPLNVLCLYVTRDVLGFMSLLAANLSIITATVLGMFAKFVLYKFWVFKQPKEDQV